MLEDTALFRPVEQLDDGLYLVQSRTEVLEFDASRLAPPAPGHEQTWFLVSTGYARDGDPNTEPLPWGK